MVESLFEVVPRLYREFDAALGRVYPERNSAHLPAFLRFGTWIGGDRDGHPRVTHDVTVEAVRLQQETMLRLYLARIEELGGRLSISAECLPVSPEFVTRLREIQDSCGDEIGLDRHEPYRNKCRQIASRIRKTIDHLETPGGDWLAGSLPAPAGICRRGEDLLQDLRETQA